jgi:hypothetical protein
MKVMGNRVTLRECRLCGAAWAFASHGLDPRQPAGVWWPADEVEWYRQYDQDDGKALLRWHGEMMTKLRAAARFTRPCRRDKCRFAGRFEMPCAVE